MLTIWYSYYRIGKRWPWITFLIRIRLLGHFEFLSFFRNLQPKYPCVCVACQFFYLSSLLRHNCPAWLNVWIVYANKTFPHFKQHFQLCPTRRRFSNMEFIDRKHCIAAKWKLPNDFFFAVHSFNLWIDKNGYIVISHTTNAPENFVFQNVPNVLCFSTKS